jgi:hypothetical protein
LRIEDVKTHCDAILDEVGKVIVGKRDVTEKVMMAVLCDGHILFEDYPGLAKTMMANTFAQASGCEFKRVQFTPDLLPADITGSYILDRATSSFVLRKGPLFTNILLADEINRAPPKTQAALLESMQERQVTLEGETHKLTRPFIVMATQNPIEYEGTYPLPEAQIDRFLIRTKVGYPTADRGEDNTAAAARPQEGGDRCPPGVQRQDDRGTADGVGGCACGRRDRPVHRLHRGIDQAPRPGGGRRLPQGIAGADAAVRGQGGHLREGLCHPGGRPGPMAAPALAHRLILAADPVDPRASGRRTYWPR